MGFQWAAIPGMLPVLLHGLMITVLATFVIMVISMVIALPVALGRMSRNPLFRIPATITHRRGRVSAARPSPMPATA